MAGYLIAEEGLLSGLIIRFETGQEWVLGRDGDVVTFALEDPMVSRKHVVCKLTPEGYVLENLSSVNPATQNGKIISEPIVLQEGDIIQIGNTFFRFSLKKPVAEDEMEQMPPPPVIIEEARSGGIGFTSYPETRWMIKVISGPNAGAEFGMQRSSTYLLGKDPTVCDIVFQDLSVSRQHARITLDENENLFIEDLGSRNGVLVNGELTKGKHQLAPQDLVALGTTSFLVIDRTQAPETIVSPPMAMPVRAGATEAEEMQKPPRDWKEMIILKRHLYIAGFLGVMLFLLVIGVVSLFHTETVERPTKNENEQISQVIKKFTDVQFSYNEGIGKLFLVGHVLTAVDKEELMYLLRGQPYIESIDDNVVVDEYVWQNMNELLAIHPDWQGITIHSPTPGRFVMAGYLQTLAQETALSDYVTMNFPYLDRLDNQVVVESNLQAQVDSLLMEKGFNNVTFQISNGELVLSGRVDEKDGRKFGSLVQQFKEIAGVRSLKNFVVMSTEDSSLVDVSDKYRVLGFSKKDGENQYVVINGRILTMGDSIDGMKITAIQPETVILEKDGLKFKINYNLQ